MTKQTRHPAKYSDVLLPIIAAALTGYSKVLDPFAGTGKLRLIRSDAYLVEIEPEWAAMGGAVIGDALYLPFDDSNFDAICTSPCYGNRMADSFVDHQPQKNYKRNTYTHILGRKLHPNNSGQMQWGRKYQEFHRAAWAECARVLREGGRMVLNISNHIRNKKEQPVMEWHMFTLRNTGFELQDLIDIETPRNRQGQNRGARVDCEYVVIMEKKTK